MPIKSKKNTKKQISNYILKKGDICCEDDFERKTIIDSIFSIYKKMDNKTYLESLNNDILIFIGYFIDLKKNNDKEGMKLWTYLDSQMPSNQTPKNDEKNIKNVLNSFPLFYLLSLLGMANYKQNNQNN